jgi:hypothetical protein
MRLYEPAFEDDVGALVIVAIPARPVVEDEIVEPVPVSLVLNV